MSPRRDRLGREEPHVDIGQLNTWIMAKTTSAVVVVVARIAPGGCIVNKGDEIDVSSEEEARGITINATHLE